MAKKKGSTAGNTKRSRKTLPRTQRLPGTSGKITSLEKAATAYVEVRDERMDLQQVEAERLAAVGSELRKTGKKEYRRELDDGTTLRVFVEASEEKVKVSIKKKKGEDD